MQIKPMFRNNIGMSAHPLGLEADVRRQIQYVKDRGAFAGPKTALIIGSSTGYGLATRISLAFGAGTQTLGVSFDKPPTQKRTGSVGWYNTVIFDREAEAAGIPSRSIFGDAFSHDTREQVIDALRDSYGPVDLFIYSVASGVRVDPDTGEEFRSVLKPIGSPYRTRSIDVMTDELGEAVLEPATEEEIQRTVKVMGGEDWALWVNALLESGMLASGAQAVAYTYIGPKQTQPVYRDGTIGKAKEHLEDTAHHLDRRLSEAVDGRAFTSVNKAIVSRAAAMIPSVPVYLGILMAVMTEKGLEEGAIEQMYRLLTERLYAGAAVPVDEQGRIRLDDREMRSDVQEEVSRRWDALDAGSLSELARMDLYRQSFLELHGFGISGIDYDADCSTDPWGIHLSEG